MKNSENNDALKEIGERLVEPSELEIYRSMETEELETFYQGLTSDGRVVDQEAREIYREARDRAIKGGNNGKG